MAGPQSAKVVRVSLDEPLTPIPVEDRYREVLMVVSTGGSVLGHVYVSVLRSIRGGAVPVDLQRSAIANQLGGVIWRQRLRGSFRGPARSGDEPVAPVSVAAVVCTRNRVDQLGACIESLLALERPADEILVVDNAPSDHTTRELCERYPVRYLLEPSAGQTRARNRGIVETRCDAVAFTDDDCTVDPRWLSGIEGTFADPLVMAVTGYIGPLELEARAQYLFEIHGGFERHPEARRFDGASGSPLKMAAVAGAGANSIFRRSVFEEVGLFAEDLGPGTPARSSDDKEQFYRILAAGYRIEYEPSRIVWHRHRKEYEALRRILNDYTVAEFAYTTRALLRHREPHALRIQGWWLAHIARELRDAVKRKPRRIPFELVRAEALGVLEGPSSLVRSARSRRGVPALEMGATLPAAPPRVTSDRDVRLSVAVPSYNRREQLRAVLLALADDTYPRERFEVVVTIDGSSDASAEMVRSLELPYTLRLFEQENRGLAVTRNRGAEEAREPVVVFLDDDIRPVPGFLAEHARAHVDSPEPHLALGYYPPVLDRGGLWAHTLRAWWEDHFRRKAEPGHQWTYIDLCDGNASMPRELWLSSGGWDQDFTQGRRQDWEYAVRLLAKGVRFSYNPGAKGWHHLDTRFATAVRNSRQEARWDVLLGSKHPQILGQLPLAGLVPPGYGLSRRVRFAYRRPDVLERAIRAGTPLVEKLDALRARRRARALMYRLIGHSYVLGLTDGLPSQRALLDFVAPISRGDDVQTVSVALGADDGLVVPPGAGVTELILELDGEPVARVPAMRPGGQWDWREVTERVVEEASEPVRVAMLDRQLDLGGGGNGNGKPPP